MAASRAGSSLELDYYGPLRTRPSFSSSSSFFSPSELINSLFTSTLNAAVKTLISITSPSSSTSKLAPHSATTHRKWGLADHLRFLAMLVAWATFWFHRVLMDHFPWLGNGGGGSHMSRLCYQLQARLPSALVKSFNRLAPSSSSLTYLTSSSFLTTTTSSATDMVLYEGDSVRALGRALSHILVLLNEIPASSRKYQFAMTMADKMLEENARYGHAELLHVNRTVLSLAFTRTSSLLYRTLQRAQSDFDESRAWPTLVIASLPMGSYINSYIKGVKTCVSTVLRYVGNGTLPWSDIGQQLAVSRGGRGSGGGSVCGIVDEREVAAEKLAQELLWITNKLRDFGAVEEALEQWSFASGLASLCLNANARVQGFIIKIYAILFKELRRENTEMPREIKFGMLVPWLPLCCHGGMGLSYPTLSGLEKMEMECAMDEVISSLPAVDQEVILTNWFQEFALSPSDWPNLQATYDRWCHCTRRMV